MTAERDRLAALLHEARVADGWLTTVDVHQGGESWEKRLADRLIAAGVTFTDVPLTSERIWAWLENDPTFVAHMEQAERDFVEGRTRPFHLDIDEERLARALLKWTGATPLEPTFTVTASPREMARGIAAAYRRDEGSPAH